MVAFYLGPLASYTHSAAKILAKDQDLVPAQTISSVFELIANDHVGIIPLENSIFGSVLETIDALLLFPHLEISSETNIAINHCIVTINNSQISKISKIISHPQALGQCIDWISKKLNKGIERLETSSTAKAASDLSKYQSDFDGVVAAICSKECADFYGLCILEESIQNSRDNRTRFIKIKCKKNCDSLIQIRPYKTLISFTVDHEKPGALSLALLALNQVQLTRIDSRPSQRKAWEYIFYIEMIGNSKEEILLNALINVQNSNAYLKLMTTRTLRIATAKPIKRFQLSPSSGGLGSVVNQSALVVTRQFEMLNVLIGYEQANKYAIKSFDGADVGFIIEEDSSILKSIVRQMLLTRRPFNASILDVNGQVVLKIRRPIKWFLNSEIRVYNAQDELLGEVKQVWHLWRRQYELFLGKKQFAAIDTGFLGWDFQLVDAQGRHLAAVNRAFRGFAREIFTDTGSYAIHLENGSVRRLSLQERAVVLCCAITIDIDYFSRHSGRGGFTPFFFMGGRHDSELTSDSTPKDLSSSPEFERNGDGLEDWLDGHEPEDGDGLEDHDPIEGDWLDGHEPEDWD